jgi:hypothetical protein
LFKLIFFLILKARKHFVHDERGRRGAKTMRFRLCQAGGHARRDSGNSMVKKKEQKKKQEEEKIFYFDFFL